MAGRRRRATVTRPTTGGAGGATTARPSGRAGGVKGGFKSRGRGTYRPPAGGIIAGKLRAKRRAGGVGMKKKRRQMKTSLAGRRVTRGWT